MQESIAELEKFLENKEQNDFSDLFELNERMRGGLRDAELLIQREIYRSGLEVIFNWSEWEKGIAWIQEDGNDVSDFTLVELCMLLTTIIRADRFNEGLFSSCVAKNKVYVIISSIKAGLKG